MTIYHHTMIISFTMTFILILIKLIIGIALGMIIILASAINSIWLFHFLTILPSVEKLSYAIFNYRRGKRKN